MSRKLFSKSPREIKLIKKAVEISNSCLSLIEKSLHEEISEIELRRRIRRKINNQGATLAFQTIVASGKRSAEIHAKPRATEKIIEGIGYVDFGARYKGYCSDLTVPFIKGKISEKERKIVQTTVKAYEIAVNSIEVGKYWWEPFDKVNKFLKKNNFKMQHALGHGIGKKIHERPTITIPSKKRLKIRRIRKKRENFMKRKLSENMIFTIEPAIYVNGVGGCRIENDILLTRKGPKVLSKARLIQV